MTAQYGRAGHYILQLWFFLLFFFLPSSFFLVYSQRSQIGCRPYFHTRCSLSANLECRCDMCCTRLAEIQDAKIRHLRTIAQSCRAISTQLRHISTVGKKVVKQQYLLYVSSQYGELRPTNGWDRLASLGHPWKFQRVSRLEFVILVIWSTAFIRGRHVHSTGRPSCWASANIV